MSTVPEGTIFNACYVTTDIDKAIAHWVDAFGAGPFFKLVVPADFGERTYRGKPAQDSIITAIGFSGGCILELIQPSNDAPSVFQEVLKEKGDRALHHIMPNCRPISASEYDARDRKYRALGYVPAITMKPPGLGRATFYDARPQIGSFVELLEISTSMYAGFEKMYSAHVGWDGKRPIRDGMEVMMQMAPQ